MYKKYLITAMPRLGRVLSTCVLCACAAHAVSASATLLSPSQLSGTVTVAYSSASGTEILCTGALVGQNTVLTAAHCGEDSINPNSPTVRFASDSRAVSKTTPNPTYNSSTGFGDFQVLTLAQAAPAYAQTYSLYGSTVSVGQRADTFGVISGHNTVQINDLNSTAWLANSSDVAGGDSGGPLLGAIAGVPTLLGNISFAFDTNFDGFFDQVGGALFKDFIDVIQAATSDIINVVFGALDGSAPPPPPPPPPPPLQYSLLTEPLTIFGADDPACTAAFLEGQPCPSLLTKSAPFLTSADGSVFFVFDYATDDEVTDFDPAGYFIGDEFFQLTRNGDETSFTRSGGFDVVAGVPFGFYVDSIDQGFGGAKLTVQTLLFTPTDDPNAVPEPESLTLFGIAILALVAGRRSRSAAG